MIFDIIGWVGMILVLIAYILLSTNKINNGFLYQFLNLSAALLMAIGLYPKNAWFSFTLQVIWGLVAAIAIIKLINTKK
ncbi:MAG: hypothetical protein NC483_03630 [Ruminococcus sp.]|nr:hypothetical protein [Ruminococcus sp.]